MNTKYNWQPIEESDLDDGTHTCYGCKDASGNLLWLTQLSDGSWDVEAKMKIAGGYHEYIHTVVNCKSLTSAKRWVSRYW